MATRREFLTAAAAATAGIMTQAHAHPLAGGQRLFIGTSNPGPNGGTGKGIYVASFHTGALSHPLLAAECVSPSFLAVRGGTQLYTILFGDGPQNTVAASYAIPASTELAHQMLQPIAQADCADVGGCHISLSPDGNSVFVANYSGGSVTSLRATPDGHLTRVSFHKFPSDGLGPQHDRQDTPHGHSALVAPGGKFVLVNDLGRDRIAVFAFDAATSKLTPHKPDHWASAPGAGPRHLVFHPNGKWIYCINELNSTISQLQWDADRGRLTTLSTVNTLPAGISPHIAKACEMAFSRDMRFLYASNRVHESFAVFSIDAATGALHMIQELPNPGKEARHIVLDPTGQWFLSANQFSGDVSVFPIDTPTGKLKPRTAKIEVAGASCLLFA